MGAFCYVHLLFKPKSDCTCGECAGPNLCDFSLKFAFASHIEIGLHLTGHADCATGPDSHCQIRNSYLMTEGLGSCYVVLGPFP